ncbi:hypothetical protein CC86DRAFT_394027 [Ophiobolus disseminans]|uniref:20S-pre-rRNA D-site endonuclease NOB1 n=1 Tax=Ophiobolus disseminans TaxID=1469910 RepID=A0A6A7A2F3_9PLEO|nr:hypothetical protein CC86DRAFT_394027 [Ophiobolus disseminans]
MAAVAPPKKPIHSLILDTGPLIKNAVAISTIINSAEEIFTTSAIISEIRDAATRSRVQTTLMPFLKVRNPSQTSYDAVIAFSKKTGDYTALSKQDLGILALAYEVHCERNGGPWGLREAPKHPIKMRPGEKSVTDEEKPKDESTDAATEDQEQKVESKPKKIHKKKERKRLAKAQEAEAEAGNQLEAEQQGEAATATLEEQTASTSEEPAERSLTPESNAVETKASDAGANGKTETAEKEPSAPHQIEQDVEQAVLGDVQSDAQKNAVEEDATPGAQQEEQMTPEDKPAASPAQGTTISESPVEPQVNQQQEPEEQTSTRPAQDDSDFPSAHDDLPQDFSTLNITTPPATDSDTDSDSDWITPSNLHAHQAADAGLPPTNPDTPSHPAPQLDVATMTIDFAMQNVLLQMNLHLLSPNMQRIKTLTSKVLRCHACFLIERDTTKHFCPRCGAASLLRVNCSTNARGEFRLHLAKNYTFNKRGDKYSIPKPIAGTANGKWSGVGGGQGGWGRDLVLSADQKEYTHALGERRKAERNLMDEDCAPGILSGDRGGGRAGGRVRVGAGKDVNSKKRF